MQGQNETADCAQASNGRMHYFQAYGSKANKHNKDTQDLVVRCMKLDDPLRVPLRVDIRVGKNWKEAK